VRLPAKIIIGMLLGAVAGTLGNSLAADTAWVKWIGDNVAGPVGQIFLRMLLMTIVPLLFCSVALGVVRRRATRAIGSFLVSSGLAATLGFVLVDLVRQGNGLLAGGAQVGIDTFINIVPKNPVKAAAEFDLLGIIVFALVFGAALAAIPEEKAKPMVRLLDAVGEAILKMIDFAMRLAPYGMFGLIFVTTSHVGWAIAVTAAKYVVVVLAGFLLTRRPNAERAPA